MSTTAVGRIRVDATPPQSPLHNLLSVPGVLQDGGRWDGGINLWGYSTAIPLTWDACSSGTFREKDDGSGNTRAESGFDTFAIYVAEQCTTASVAGDLDGFVARTEAVLEATSSFAVEQALSQGVDNLDNPYLADGNLDVLATNVSARVGIAYLENAIGATGRRGMIHITPAVAISAGLVLDNLDNPQPLLITPAGNAISIGGGYIGADPTLADVPASGAAAPSTTKDWIFATGVVQAWVSPLLEEPGEISGLIDHEVNDVIYRAERLAAVGWDGALQAGVLVDWTT